MTQQTQTIKRTPLQKFDVPGTAYETVIGIAEIAANATIGRHTHPGPESGYMLEGEMVLMIDGQPEKTLRAGDSYQIPAGAVHDARTGPKARRSSRPMSSKRANPLQRLRNKLPRGRHRAARNPAIRR